MQGLGLFILAISDTPTVLLSMCNYLFDNPPCSMPWLLMIVNGGCDAEDYSQLHHSYDVHKPERLRYYA